MRQAVERPSGYRAEFFSGVQPLCQWFKSATVLLTASGASPAAVSDGDHIRAVQDWLKGYDAWYRSGWRSGMAADAPRPLCCTIGSSGPRAPLSHLDALCSLSELGLRLGMAFAYTFDAGDFAQHEEAARRLGAHRGLANCVHKVSATTPRLRYPPGWRISRCF